MRVAARYGELKRERERRSIRLNGEIFARDFPIWPRFRAANENIRFVVSRRSADRPLDKNACCYYREEKGKGEVEGAEKPLGNNVSPMYLVKQFSLQLTRHIIFRTGKIRATQIVLHLARYAKIEADRSLVPEVRSQRL